MNSLTKITLRKFLDEDLTFKKRTEAVASDVFGTKKVTYTEYPIKGLIRVITLEDLRFLPPGVLEVGNARGFFYKEYETVDGIKKIEPADIIVKNGVEWKVERILPFPIHGEELIEARLVRA